MHTLLIASWKTPHRAIVEKQKDELVLLLEAFPKEKKLATAREHLYLMKRVLIPENYLDSGPDGRQWLRISMRDYEHLAELPAAFLSKALGSWSVELVTVPEQLAA